MTRKIPPTSYALLGLLSLQPWTTYELARQSERSLRWFFPRAERGVYQEAKRLVDLGWATSTATWAGRRKGTTYEITEHNPPHMVAFRGVDGSIRVIGRATIEPLDGGARSRVTLDLDFEGHGMGKLLLPLVRNQAAKQVPKDQARLKERLESGTPAA